MKVYIAGKITGDENYKEKFAKKAKEITERGNIVLNPAELPGGLTQEEYMTICFAMIDVCDKVYFLKDWTDSVGATREMYYTRAKQKRIEYEVK